MSGLNDWQSVRDEVLRRIHSREWAPGEAIPTEAELAEQFGCARTTVNRALRAVAEAGLLDRKRRAGTRVALHPPARAVLTIPVLRLQIEATGAAYGYRLLHREEVAAPEGLTGDRALHLRALHLSDGAPYALEDRWIDLGTVPSARKERFEDQNPNEWLLAHAPFTEGSMEFSAQLSDASHAELAAPGLALFALQRTTRDGARTVTRVRIVFAPGYRVETGI